MPQFKLTGDYGTFVIQRTVEAADKDEAFTLTGISTTLEAAGWTMLETPEGEEWEITEVVGTSDAIDDELNADERKAVSLIDGDERLAFFAAGCGSDDLELRLIDEVYRNDLDINVDNIDFVKLMNQFQNT